MNCNTLSSVCHKIANFLAQCRCQKQLKGFLAPLFFVFFFLQVCNCTNILPLTWSYLPDLIQCGQYTVTSPSLIPTSPGTIYNMTFNRLVNPTTSYGPAVGWVDLSYKFIYNQQAYINVYSFQPAPTSVKIGIYGFNNSNLLTRCAFNYFVVSNNLNDIFIWIDNLNYGVNQAVNITNPFTTTKTRPQALPSTSINTIISIKCMALTIKQISNLFDYQVSIILLNKTSYNCTISSPLANTMVSWVQFSIIFYEQIVTTYIQTLLIPYSYSQNTASDNTTLIVSSNNLVDSFEVNNQNSFFSFSRISTLLSDDFKVNYITSPLSISLSFNQTKAITASVFIIRQSPTCPLYYIINLVQMICVCNNIICYEGIGCVSAEAIGANSNCVFCSIVNNFILDLNGNCICKTGYQLTNEACQQICGDGIKFNDQCDDGNKINGDGCSSQCMIQNGFQCYQNSSGASICLFIQNICFTLTYVQKNDDNSAIFTFQAIGNSFPLSFPVNSFNVNKTLNLTILRNDSTTCDIKYSISKIYDQTVQIFINFQQNIEGFNAVINFNFNSTNYLSQDCTLKFICKGSGMPLITSLHGKQFKLLGNINLVFICLLSIVFTVSMLAPKWIGIESMQVNQLIFFSQLLITDASNWPIAFQIFKYFKYSNGFNNIFSRQSVQTFSNNSKKWNFLNFQPAFILNFLISFLLILFFLIMYFLLRPNRKECQNQEQQQLALEKKIKIQYSQQSVSNQSKKQRKLYQFFVNVAVWSLLQFLASIISQFVLLIKPFNNYDFIVPLKINNLLMLASQFVIVCVGFNFFANILLSQQTLGALKHKPQLQIYKRVNFVYHFLLGAFMFCFNSFTFKGIPISVLFFVSQILYIMYIFRLRPYKQCVWIHTVGFIFNRFGYLIFLGFITLKNFFVNINEIIMLIMCYFIVAFIFIMIILSIVRLYYDLRYGEEYEKKMEDIKKAKQLEQKLIRKQKQEYELQEIRQAAKKKHSKTDSRQVKDKNKYRIECIILEEQQIQMLQFIEKKNWSKLQKEKYYYQKYAEKPLIWLQKHDKKQYQIRMRELNQKNKNKNNKKDKISEKDQRNIQELEKFKRKRRQELKQLKIRKETKKEKKKD